MKLHIILAIESSCDETAASVVQDGQIVLSSVVASQIPLHARYGGVVPEIAARAHTEAILGVINQSLGDAFGKGSRFDQMKMIDVLAVTEKPGLTGSLLVGKSTAKALALVFNKPLIPVDHIMGHVYSNMLTKLETRNMKLETNENKKIQKNSNLDIISNFKFQISNFPLITLVASGGHTELILSRSHHNHAVISQTRDDAAGEAFDKVATLLNLSYPGGPSVSQAAITGDATIYPLPRGLSKSDSLDFSFSGLKTAVAQLVKHLQNDGVDINSVVPHIAASFQASVVDSLVSKTVQAAEKYQVSSIGLAGGVAANTALRSAMHDVCLKNGIDFYTPSLEFCTDNAAMIGAAAFHMWQTNNGIE